MRKIILIFFLAIATVKVHAQEFMIQSWYWNYPTYVVTDFYMEYLESLADEFHEAGFTYVWLPPLSKGSGGSYSMGYDVKDYYDLGDFLYAVGVIVQLTIISLILIMRMI
ncbi:MAG: hypothetical protein IPG60_00880 [Bacteroidetes bacterium]|nr:hypothetical protein [Bacteroidota bacterium]